MNNIASSEQNSAKTTSEQASIQGDLFFEAVQVQFEKEKETLLKQLEIAAEHESQETVVENEEEPEIHELENDDTDEAQNEEYSEEQAESESEEEFYWDGEVITPYSGVANGPSGYETYYNLPMEGVVSIMRGLGYDEENYPYWIRDDGAKMLGSYIMVAANLDIRPYGTILPCSLGMAIVCDTGTFAQANPYQLDIAVAW